MFNVQEIWVSKKKFKIATGLTTQEADIIFKDFEEKLVNLKRVNSESKVGRPPKLSTKEIFLMLMMFIRHYPTYEFLSVVFDIDVANVKRWIEASYASLGDVLVKKNFANLIVLKKEMLQKSRLGNSEKFILMELNNLLGDQRIM